MADMTCMMVNMHDEEAFQDPLLPCSWHLDRPPPLFSNRGKGSWVMTP